MNFESFNQLKDEPLALIVLGGVVLIKLIEYGIKFAPQVLSFIFKGEKITPYWKWQNIMNGKMDNFEKQMLSFSQSIKDTAVQAANSVVWGDKSPPFVEVIRACLLNIKLEQNGNLRQRMVEVINGFSNGKEIYKSLLNDFTKLHKERGEELSSYFYETIVWIDQRLV